MNTRNDRFSLGDLSLLRVHQLWLCEDEKGGFSAKTFSRYTLFHGTAYLIRLNPRPINKLRRIDRPISTRSTHQDDDHYGDHVYPGHTIPFLPIALYPLPSLPPSHESNDQPLLRQRHVLPRG